MFEWLRERGHLGHMMSAAAMVLLVAIVVVLPLGMAVPRGGDEIDQIRQAVQDALQAGLPGAPEWLAAVPLVGESLSELWNHWAADLSSMASFFQPYYGEAGKFLLVIVLGLANGVLLFVLALVIAFFFYAAGENIAAHLVAILRRIAGSQADRLITVTGATIRGVVYGILGTAVVQGILTTFGLWVTGVPRPLLLGVIAGGLSVLPIGAPAIWIPAALWLMSSGHIAWGIVLMVYGGVAISGADSIIRPFFISRGAQLPFLLTMLGVLGGALAFGLLGVFVGPVLLGVGYTLAVEYGRGDPATT